MSAMLTEPGTLVEARWIYAHSYVVGTDRVFDFEVYSPDGQTEAKLGCTHPWCRVSTNGGASYVDIPTNVQQGIEMGPLTAGQRKAIKVKLAIPPGTAARTRSVGLPIGLGV